MRLKTAAALVLLGLLTLLAGIGQRTIWAPAETFTASVPESSAQAPLTVIDQGLRTLHGGTPTITVEGDGSFLLAAGRPDDIEAWVGKTAHNTVSGVSEDGKDLQVEHADGEASAPNPAASDLWVATENASGELEYSWTPPADGDWSLLLASDGTKPAPAKISMTFPNDTSTPWAIPLMVFGGLLILAGVFIGLGGAGAIRGGGKGLGGGFARKARARSEAKARSRQASGLSLVAAGLAASLVALSGSVAHATTPSPEPTGGASSADASPGGAGSGAGSEAMPVLLDTQFRRILEQVSSAVESADAAKNAGKLASRVAGTELEVRTQNYKIRSKVATYAARMPVRATKLLTTVVTTDRAWPRSVLAVTQGDGNVVPQLLTLVQASPRENYKLVETTPLQPGATFPSISRDGTDTLAADDKSGLLYSGAEAMAGLADRLSKSNSAFKSKLVEGKSSPYIADTLSYQAEVAKSGTNGNFTFTHKVVPDSTVVFRTSDGGALVLGRINFGFQGTPKADGDKLTIGSDAAALAGGTETTTGMVLTFAESVAVYVPPAGSADPMKLVAATRGLVGASFK